MPLRSIEGSKLWFGLTKISENPVSVEDLGKIVSLTNYAGDFLDRIVETFPNYTWHNRRHALNVVEIMDDLLSGFNDIQPMEYALLLISAFMHDIGMNLTDSEKKLLFENYEFQKVPKFNLFLSEKPEHDVILSRLKKDNKVEKTVDKESVQKLNAIALDYCRWAHAARVEIYLRDVRKHHPDWLMWDGTSIEDAINLVCESHNWNVEKLRSTNNGPALKLNINFAGKADLLFCALILRLADIMDFDRSRTPEHVYRSLQLSENNELISDVEWRKHMSADGFEFPTPDERDPHYMVPFSGKTEKPEIEVAINQFLHVIQQEIEACRILLTSCSSKKQRLRLPDGIDNQFRTKGFLSGGYRFVVDERSVIGLLMGEKLYSDDYVFVRELVQNAVDTVRYRALLFPKDTFDTTITISEFPDEHGNRWIRIDDNGMGMDEKIIKNYLLQIGKSYYRSADFELATLKIAQQHERINLVPISRYGIGILSCFMRGDVIEINTKQEEGDGFRVRLLGLDAFHIVQSEKAGHNEPRPMPQVGEFEEGYRLERGTSIAIRLNPRQTHFEFDLQRSLEEYILFPKVSIKFNGNAIGGDYEKIIEKTWIDRIKIELTPQNMADIERVLDWKFLEPLSLVLQPLNLTEWSPNRRELAGQAIVTYVEMSEYDQEHLWDEPNVKRDIYVSWNLDHTESAVQLKPPELSVSYNNKPSREKADIELRRLKTEFAELEKQYNAFDGRWSSLGFSHGIVDLASSSLVSSYFRDQVEMVWYPLHLKQVSDRYLLEHELQSEEVIKEAKRIENLWREVVLTQFGGG